MIADHLATAAPALDPAASYLISHGVGHLLLPLLEAYLLIRIMQFAAAKVSEQYSTTRSSGASRAQSLALQCVPLATQPAVCAGPALSCADVQVVRTQPGGAAAADRGAGGAARGPQGADSVHHQHPGHSQVCRGIYLGSERLCACSSFAALRCVFLCQRARWASVRCAAPAWVQQAGGLQSASCCACCAVVQVGPQRRLPAWQLHVQVPNDRQIRPSSRCVLAS